MDSYIFGPSQQSRRRRNFITGEAASSRWCWVSERLSAIPAALSIEGASDYDSQVRTRPPALGPTEQPLALSVQGLRFLSRTIYATIQLGPESWLTTNLSIPALKPVEQLHPTCRFPNKFFDWRSTPASLKLTLLDGCSNGSSS